MSFKSVKSTYRVIRTITVDKDKLSTVAELLGIKKGKLKPGKLMIVQDDDKPKGRKKSP